MAETFFSVTVKTGGRVEIFANAEGLDQLVELVQGAKRTGLAWTSDEPGGPVDESLFVIKRV